MDAIRKAASAPMSVRHSADLNEIRDKSPSGDEDSLTYEDVASSAAPSRLEETAEQKGDELYDDNVDENFYEAVGSGPAKEINYEISEAQASVSTGRDCDIFLTLSASVFCNGLSVSIPLGRRGESGRETNCYQGGGR